MAPTVGRRQTPRVITGIPGLDRVLGGGFLEGSTHILIGGPGTGKTILATQVAFHHVASGGRAIVVTVLTESHSRLIEHLSVLDFFDDTVIPDALPVMDGRDLVRAIRANDACKDVPVVLMSAARDLGP